MNPFPTEPGPNSTYVPAFRPTPESPDIEYVREYGKVVCVSPDGTVGTAEVVKDGVVSFCAVTLNTVGMIKDFSPKYAGINKYAKSVPVKKGTGDDAPVIGHADNFRTNERGDVISDMFLQTDALPKPERVVSVEFFTQEKQVEPKKETVRPLGDRVLVKREKPEDKSPGGIHLPDRSQDKSTRGTVVAVGPGSKRDSSKDDVLVFNYPANDRLAKENAEDNARRVVGRTCITNPQFGDSWSAVEQRPTRNEMPVKVGDVVLFTAYAGTNVTVNGEEFVLLREDELLGVVTQ